MEEKDFAIRLAQLRTKKNVSQRSMSIDIGQNQNYMITLNSIILRNKETRYNSICHQLDEQTEYQNMENALCGKAYPQTFSVKRLVVYQMK
jgi:hypothetical protein